MRYKVFIFIILNTKATTIKKYSIILLCNVLLAGFFGCKKQTDAATCPGYAMYIPNSFMPNKDGLNDVFQPKAVWVKGYEMRIYDRTGAQLYYTTNVYKGWDGTVQGGSVNTCPEGKYLYKITAGDTCGNTHSYEDYFYLIK